jgi:hypothetical protein
MKGSNEAPSADRQRGSFICLFSFFFFFLDGSYLSFN